MMQRISKRTLVIIGASGALALGIATPAAVAWAADRDKGQVVQQRDTKLAEALAKELGIEQSRVQEALQKVREQLKAEAEANRPPAEERKGDHLERLKSRLAEAVTAGSLTQAEADAIIKAAEAGLLNGGRGHGPGGPGRVDSK